MIWMIFEVVWKIISLDLGVTTLHSGVAPIDRVPICSHKLQRKPWGLPWEYVWCTKKAFQLQQVFWQRLACEVNHFACVQGFWESVLGEIQTPLAWTRLIIMMTVARIFEASGQGEETRDWAETSREEQRTCLCGFHCRGFTILPKRLLQAGSCEQDSK